MLLRHPPAVLTLAFIAILGLGTAAQAQSMSAEEMARALGLSAGPAKTPGKPRYRAPSFEVPSAAGDTPATGGAVPRERHPFIDVIVEFDVNSAKIGQGSIAQVEEVHRLLADNPQLTLNIVGHTDASGDPARNQILSTRRAAAVLSFLTAEGIAPNRLASEGRGASQPLPGQAANSPRNRRVQFIRTDD